MNPFSEQDFTDKFRMCLPYSSFPLGELAADTMIEDILALEDNDDVVTALLMPLIPG